MEVLARNESDWFGDTFQLRRKRLFVRTPSAKLAVRVAAACVDFTLNISKEQKSCYRMKINISIS